MLRGTIFLDLGCWHGVLISITLILHFFHITTAGRKTLENLSRDPSNPAGYLAALGEFVPGDSVTGSYVKEALETYNSNCYKASAVMIGSASESLILNLRDKVVKKLEATNAPVTKNLSDWRVKRILTGLQEAFDARKRTMPSAISERYEFYWSAFAGHLRMARNDTGQPNAIAPLAHDVVHGSLLIFPELSKLIFGLGVWVDLNFI